jgi:hypothetical protein
MVLADSYPFFGVLWSMLVFFLWVAWFMMLFHVIGDVFRRRDASGWNKTAWLIFVICAPFLGVFVYLIVNGSEMAQRDVPRNEPYAGEVYNYSPTPGVGRGMTAEIERAKGLLDSGAITEPEFQQIKARAIG